MSVIKFSTNVRAKEVPEVLLLWPCGDYYKIQEPADWYIEIDLWLRISQTAGIPPGLRNCFFELSCTHRGVQLNEANRTSKLR